MISATLGRGQRPPSVLASFFLSSFALVFFRDRGDLASPRSGVISRFDSSQIRQPRFSPETATMTTPAPDASTSSAVVPSRRRIALITGAGGGIGRATALLLARHGWNLILWGRTGAKVEAVAREIAAIVPETQVRAAECDVANRAWVDRQAQEDLDALGGLDALVCNAGTNIKRRAMAELDPADWDRLLAANLTGAYNVTRAVLPTMRARRNGTIIQICSISGMRASPLGGVAYSASKYGQAALGITLSREERQHGIRSTVIYPGEVDTAILDQRPNPVGVERRALILQPEDVAEAVRFVLDLPARAHVFELVIKPTVDDFA